MDIALEKGCYVIGVSGGVDSIALLDMLHKKPGLRLIVAHFNHGIRTDSKKDEDVVVKIGQKYDLLVEVGRGNLGNKASEDTARQARYTFLEKIRKKHKAKAIITAHHQDDFMETAILNILRGTGRKGLSSIADNSLVVRPLLNVPKASLIRYAKRNKLVWREDSSNADDRYLRNRLRKTITLVLRGKERAMLLKNIEKVAKNNRQIDELIATISHELSSNNRIDRSLFVILPTEIEDELVAFWLRKLGVNQFNKRTVNRLRTAMKVAPAGTNHAVSGDFELVVDSSSARFSKTAKVRLL